MPWEDAPVRNFLEMAFYDPEFQMREALGKNLSKLLTPPGALALISYSDRAQSIAPIETFFPNMSIKTILQEKADKETHFILKIS